MFHTQSQRRPLLRIRNQHFVLLNVFGCSFSTCLCILLRFECALGQKGHLWGRSFEWTAEMWLFLSNRFPNALAQNVQMYGFIFMWTVRTFCRMLDTCVKADPHFLLHVTWTPFMGPSFFSVNGPKVATHRADHAFSDRQTFWSRKSNRKNGNEILPLPAHFSVNIRRCEVWPSWCRLIEFTWSKLKFDTSNLHN